MIDDVHSAIGPFPGRPGEWRHRAPGRLVAPRAVARLPLSIATAARRGRVAVSAMRGRHPGIGRATSSSSGSSLCGGRRR